MSGRESHAIEDAVTRERGRVAAYLRRRATWWSDPPADDAQLAIAGALLTIAEEVEQGGHAL